MRNNKTGRLDESFSGQTLEKALTGNTGTSINTGKITVNSGVVHSANSSSSQDKNSNSQANEK